MISKVNQLVLTIIAPAHNEGENLTPLVSEIARAIDPLNLNYEIIIVDDVSTDESSMILKRLSEEFPRLRVLRLGSPYAKGPFGQSAAFQAGIRASRGLLIATLDADLQSDPAELPPLLELLNDKNADLVQGDRSGRRQDGAFKRFGSLVGRLFRRILLGDSIRDTGCSLRVMRRSLALALPLQYRGLHRFIPIMARQLGFTVIEAPVHHRPRMAGHSKYSNLSRALPGLIDCFVVRWMGRRRIRPTIDLLENSSNSFTEAPCFEPTTAHRRETIEL